jgi:phage gpG-like protein
VITPSSKHMKNSTVNRIARSKTSPSGERWEALSEITIALKGHDQPLFQSGEMMRGIDIGDVSNDGFMITSAAPHSSWMQKGVRKKRGTKKNPRGQPGIPARPFMGFSNENVRRISKMLHDHIKKGG